MSCQGRKYWLRYHNQPNKIFWFLDDKMQFIGAISVGKCAICKQLRGQFKQKKRYQVCQKMGCIIELPITYCGVDVFGSFVVKNGWKEVNKYDALYTFLSSRAILIEFVHSLNTGSFILSLRCFIGQKL